MSEPAAKAPKPAEETAKSPAEIPEPVECTSMCHKHKCIPRAKKSPKPASEGALKDASEDEKEEEEEEKIVVAIPIFENVTALDFVGPYEVLHLLPNVEVVFVSHSRDLYAADLGMLSFHSTATFDEVPSPDIIVVPGGGGTRDLLTDAPLLDWIRKAHETSLFTTSVCSGSLLLGAAGILKGVKATTHWCVWHMLPDYEAEPVYARIVQDGKIITSAGMTAGIDMALRLAALVTDEVSAMVVQLMMEYDPQPPFHCGSVDHAAPEIICTAKDWLENRNCWTICPDPFCFAHSEVIPDETTKSTNEAAPAPKPKKKIEKATVPSIRKKIWTAPFIPDD
ncbi:hypothetical protein M758_11G004800 [Ceratodon purpureus]|nr:hypothetical protein M758_11G004800 [Ceratodon purpureus]